MIPHSVEPKWMICRKLGQFREKSQWGLIIRGHGIARGRGMLGGGARDALVRDSGTPPLPRSIAKQSTHEGAGYSGCHMCQIRCNELHAVAHLHTRRPREQILSLRTGGVATCSRQPLRRKESGPPAAQAANLASGDTTSVKASRRQRATFKSSRWTRLLQTTCSPCHAMHKLASSDLPTRLASRHQSIPPHLLPRPSIVTHTPSAPCVLVYMVF